jgi:hypothetical protein
MKRIKIYVGLLLALALLLPLLVTPCVQAADMTEGSYYAIGYLNPRGAKIWAYGYYLSGRQTVYAMMMIQERDPWITKIRFGVYIRPPTGPAVASDHYDGYPIIGTVVSTSKLNPPSGGYVDFDVCTLAYICLPIDSYCDYWPVGWDRYFWYYPV